jgi:hypothetical protein
LKKVGISYEAGGGRLEGHYTHYSFTGLPGVEIAALADSHPEAEHLFRLTGARRLYASFLTMMEPEIRTSSFYVPICRKIIMSASNTR